MKNIHKFIPGGYPILLIPWSEGCPMARPCTTAHSVQNHFTSLVSKIVTETTRLTEPKFCRTPPSADSPPPEPTFHRVLSLPLPREMLHCPLIEMKKDVDFEQEAFISCLSIVHSIEMHA